MRDRLIELIFDKLSDTKEEAEAALRKEDEGK